MRNKHIAMWSCSRSLSTVTTRAFEQLNECLVLDSPFYTPYLIVTNSELPEKQEVLANLENEPNRIINQITGELPQGKSFSFQRHIAKTVLPQFDRYWLELMQHFFLIRHPKKIIASYYKAMQKYPGKQNFTIEDIGLKALNDIFQDIQTITGKTPLVIDADDIAQNPSQVLKFLCKYFEIDFSDKMLTWKQPGLQNSELLKSNLSYSSELWEKTWYSTISKSQGFLPYQAIEVDLTKEILPMLEESLPIYEKITTNKKVLKF